MKLFALLYIHAIRLAIAIAYSKDVDVEKLKGRRTFTLGDR